MSCTLEGKRGIYKNNLLATNSDYLNFNPEKPVLIGDEMDYTFVNTHDYLSSNPYLFDALVDGVLRLRFISGVILTTGCTITKLTSNGIDIPFNTDFKTIMGSTVVVTVTSTVNSGITSIGRRSVGGNYYSMNLLNFTINGEYFGLNEVRGDEFRGDDYNGQYKNELVAANSDYLETEFIPLSQFSDLSFSVTGTFASDGTSQQIFSYGNPSSITGAYSLFITSGAQVYFQCFNSSSTIFVNSLVETISGTVEKTYFFDGSYLYVNGVQVLDVTAFATELMNPSVSVLPKFGAYYNLARPMSADIKSLEIQGEYFGLNEPEGIVFTGTNGTTGTRTTSHAGGIEYISKTMIQGNGWTRGFRETSSVDPDYIDDTMIERYGAERGERTNTLLTANGDHLTLDSAKTILIGEKVELEFVPSSNIGTTYLFNSITPTIFRVFTISGVINLIDGCTITTLTANGVDINTGIGTDLDLYAGQKVIMIVEATVNTEVVTICARENGASTPNLSLNRFNLSGDEFNLNEHNGAEFYGEFYVKSTNSITVTNASDQKISLTKSIVSSDQFSATFVFNEVLATFNHIIFSNATSTARAYISPSTGQIVVNGVIGAEYWLDGNSVPTNTDFRLHLGKVIMITGEFSLSADISFVGGVAARGSNLTFIEWMFASEKFSLPEGLGLTTTGSEGTIATLVNGASWSDFSYGTGTRITSHSGALNYINLDMNQKG